MPPGQKTLSPPERTRESTLTRPAATRHNHRRRCPPPRVENNNVAAPDDGGQHAGPGRMAAATESGAVVFPPVPVFYTRPGTVDDIVGHWGEGARPVRSFEGTGRAAMGRA